MKNPSSKINSLLCFAVLFLFLATLVASCGYRLVGSGVVPFNSVTIKPVQNRTYEPKLEEKLHNALAGEFIHQGLEVRPAKGDLDVEAVITSFALGAVGAVDTVIKEQEILMSVDIKITDHGFAREFRAMRSPIKITFQSTGTVSEAASRKDAATMKACSEIAKEIVSKMIMEYAK